MERQVPGVRQPPGSNSCLPAAVLSILLWELRQEPDESLNLAVVSEWCGETNDGCVLDLAMAGLTDAGWDVQELSGITEREVRDLLHDPDLYAPLLVTVLNPRLPASMDHAVVLVDVVERSNDEAGPVELVIYMDPLTGSIVTSEAAFFWQCWDFAGSRAFCIRR